MALKSLALTLHRDARALVVQGLNYKTHIWRSQVKRILTAVAMLGLASFGLNLSAQQTPSTQDRTGSAQQQVDTQNQQSSRSFEGKIAKSGDKLVLQDSSTQTAYQLDDQSKAKQYEGKSVKVTATMDPNTNTLHVVDITPSEGR
jgi:hypothetical protein